VFFFCRTRMNGNVETQQKLELIASYLFKGLLFQNWQWFHHDINVLFVEKVRVQQPYCCEICMSEVGI